jgi:hypothetical protein
VSKFKTSYEWLFTVTWQDTISLLLYDNSDSHRRGLVSTAAVTSYEGSWVHFMGTYDGRGGDNAQDGITLYINGVSVATSSIPIGSYTAMHNTASVVEIGSIADFSTYANGKIAQVGIWNEALTGSEVLELYNDGGLMDWTINEGNYNSSSNLVGYWPLTAGSGTTAADHSTNGNDGTLTNGPSWSYALPSSAISEPNYSVSFDGANDYIEISDSDNFSFGDGSTDSAFSVSAWIYMDDATKFRIIAKTTKTGTSGMEWAISIDGLDRLSFNLYDGLVFSVRIGVATSAITAKEGTWTHILATYDGSSTSNGMSLYLDGVLQSVSANNQGVYTAMHNYPIDVTVGADFQGAAPSYANGKIAQVGIWDVELTSDEIASMYSDGEIIDLTQDYGYYQSKANLVAYWPLDEGSGTTATDNSGNGHNGTLTNGPIYSTDVP